MDLGIDSFKIEGRMKTIHYVASVVSVYRRIMDGEDIPAEESLKLLSRVNNRGYSYGFMKGGVTPEDYSQGENSTNSTSTFVANYLSHTKDGTTLRVRNRIFAGDKLEVLSPDGKIYEMEMPKPFTKKDGTHSAVVQNEDEIIIKDKVQPYSLFRKVKEDK